MNDKPDKILCIIFIIMFILLPILIMIEEK